jgi:hypothetical protein
MTLKGQKLVDEIYRRALKTNFGCGEPETSLKLSDTFGSESDENVALLLIGAFHSKYDLVAIMQATIEVLSENGEITHE